MIIRPKRSSRKPFLIVIALLLIIAAAFYFLVFKGKTDNKTIDPKPDNTMAQTGQHEERQPKVQPLPSVQKEVEDWVAQNAGEYSIVVTDLATGTELASYGADKQYFAASIYKLYVAYLGYLDIQNGEHGFDNPFLGEWTRKECLDKMIRESHSPCAEKLWAEQGKQESTERLKEYGLSGTSMLGLTTTAQDVDIILRRMYDKKELDQTSLDLYLESMKNNIYRDVLPKALPELMVRDKVGFRELVEYHDAGFVTLPNGREVAVTLLTTNAGTRRMIDLTQTIFEPLVTASR